MIGRRAIVFMGVCGCGKTTVARAFADAVGGAFLDGDDFHPPSNIAKMRGGTPLDDSDRASWLAALRSAIDRSQAAITCVACSALKRAHREELRAAGVPVDFVFLHGSEALLAQRMAGRSGHFMPAGLLGSQLAALEPPASAFAVDVAHPPGEIVSRVRAHFAL